MRDSVCVCECVNVRVCMNVYECEPPQAGSFMKKESEQSPNSGQHCIHVSELLGDSVQVSVLHGLVPIQLSA